MNIKYRLSKDELYDMIRYTLCETIDGRLTYIIKDIIVTILVLALILTTLLDNTLITNILKVIIVIVLTLITVLYIVSVVKLKGLILKHTMKYFYESKLYNTCDTDVIIKLIEI